jgi:hypothetical protein
VKNVYPEQVGLGVWMAQRLKERQESLQDDTSTSSTEQYTKVSGRRKNFECSNVTRNDRDQETDNT